jgi:hypothetical protein
MEHSFAVLVRFNLDGKGIRQWSWTSRGSNEAFVALDRDGDGYITSGRELFGNITDQPVSEEPNGFAALALFDENKDGWINANDVNIWSKLLLWVDLNHDGISQRLELKPVKGSKVEGIGLDHKISKRSDRHGNNFRFKAPLEGQGLPPSVWDIFFRPGNS